MNELDLDRLEAVARAVMQGSWVAATPADDTNETRREWMAGLSADPDAPASGLWVVWAPEDPRPEVIITAVTGDGPTGEKAAEHIATFDPPTMLALIERLRKAEAVAMAAREYVRTLREAVSAITHPLPGGWREADAAHCAADCALIAALDAEEASRVG